jgi:hypothetical protein
MNKADVINYLDERIAYFTGGDEMKSMAESCTDEMIVKELKKVRNFVIGKPERVVGVISFTVDRFRDWKIEQGHTEGKSLETKRKYIHNGVLYICLSKPEHVCGYAFDEVTRSDGAWRNKDFDKIVEYCRPALNPNGKWDL